LGSPSGILEGNLDPLILQSASPGRIARDGIFRPPSLHHDLGGWNPLLGQGLRYELGPMTADGEVLGWSAAGGGISGDDQCGARTMGPNPFRHLVDGRLALGLKLPSSGGVSQDAAIKDHRGRQFGFGFRLGEGR